MKEESIEAVYQYICEYIVQHRLSPTQREIARACFINQATVLRYLDLLQARGLIERKDGVPRSIALCKASSNEHDKASASGD